jgi:alkaline phosphatase D
MDCTRRKALGTILGGVGLVSCTSVDTVLGAPDASQPADAGVRADAGTPPDAGFDAGSEVDAGAQTDAGPDAGSEIDAGPELDAGSGELLEPGAWAAPGTEDAVAFPYGLQAGDATSSGVILSVRTREALTITVVKVTDLGWRQVYSANHGAADGVMQLEVTGLQPDTRYSWVGTIEGGSARTMQGYFRTAIASGSRTIRFGAVSCLGGNRPWPILSQAADEQLDAFLLLGDTVYADWGATETIEAKWSEALRQSGMKDLTASTSLIATWDDHEVWNNWSIPEHVSLAAESLVSFRKAIPQRIGANGEVWRSFAWGDVAEFFVLDCRSERVGGNYISQAQMDWAKAGIRASTARFKIILNSVPITDLSFLPVVGDFAANERWQGFSAQRREFVDACASVPGVLIVSGDFHIGAAAQIDANDQSGAGITEVLSGPGGSPIDRRYSLIRPGNRIKAAIRQHNYTLFECDPQDGSVVVKWIGNDGAAIEELTIQL